MINIRIKIWEGLHYEAKDEDFEPYMDTYVLDSGGVRPSVLIFPGGGYYKTSWREAEPIAMKFNAAGYNAFVLYYSVSPNRYPQPLRDAGRAMNIIRENSVAWRTDAEKIAVCGFSAGGHLAASLGTLWNSKLLMGIDGIKTEFCKPNALVLAYPVISSGEFAHRGSFDHLLGTEEETELRRFLSLEDRVCSITPPTFIWHTVSDATVPVENSLLFVQALRKHNIPFELHVYPEGVHGLSLATQDTAEYPEQINPHVSTWIKLCIKWIDISLK